jgi:hypothetical protein
MWTASPSQAPSTNLPSLASKATIFSLTIYYKILAIFNDLYQVTH